MRNFLFRSELIVFIFLCCALTSQSQYFIAGQHDLSSYFFDVEPDSTLVGPNNHPPQMLPPAIYHIDINNDGINDFELYSYGDWVNGSGESEISIRIYDTSACQVALGYKDTCHTPNSTYRLFNIAKFLKKNDTINQNLAWLNSKSYLTYTYWFVMLVDCSDNGFINDSVGNYLAVRMIRPNDTLYGWIKLTKIQFLTFTIQAYACSRNSTGIEDNASLTRIYPNPTNNIIQVENNRANGELLVYNQYGVEILTRRCTSTKTTIDLSDRPSGVYFFKLIFGSKVEIRKVIKQ